MTQVDSPLLKVTSLTKKYSSGFYFESIDFSLNYGSTTAFLGPNGAGKSTLFQMLTGNLDPSSGEILLNNKKLTPDSFLMKRKIGYLPQHLQLPRWVTGKEILNYCASLYQLDNPKSKIADMIDTWDCSSYINRPLSTCSHGMQKRIGLSIATIHSPDLLILDEPFSGLDLYHMKSLENLIISRKEHHKATILSTHINSFVAKLCQHVFVLKNGNVKVLEKWKHNSIADKISMIENEFF